MMNEKRYCLLVCLCVTLLLLGIKTLDHNNLSAFSPSKRGTADNPTQSQTLNPTQSQTLNPTQSQTLNPTQSQTLNPDPVDTALNFQHYSNPSLGITLQYPLDWSIGNVKNGIQIIAEKDITYMEIRIHDVKSSLKDLEQYVRDDMADRKNSRSGLKIIDDLSQTTISENMPAYKITYSFLKTEDPGKGETQKILRYWTLQPGKSYTVVYVANSNTFEKYMPVAEAIISSIQIGSKNQNAPLTQQVSSQNQ